LFTKYVVNGCNYSATLYNQTVTNLQPQKSE